MNRAKVVRYLTQQGCEMLREGGRHSIFINTANRCTAPLPRHGEIDWRLVLKICKELAIEPPTER